MKKSIQILLLSLLISHIAYSQLNIDTLAIQDFELSPASPTWTYVGVPAFRSGLSATNNNPANSPLGINASRAWESTSTSSGLVLTFANVIIPSGYDSIRVQFRLAAFNLTSGSGGGPDHLDFVLVSYSTNGGVNYTDRLRIRGAVANNSVWPYSATGLASVYYLPTTEAMFQPQNSGLQTTQGYSTCEIVFPGSITQLQLKINGRSSSSSDTWMIDNLLLLGENNCSNSFSAFSDTACNSYTINGQTYTSSGIYTQSISKPGGCDSIITMNLTIHQPTSSNQTATACSTYTWPVNGLTYTTSGNYTAMFTNAIGCDSVILLQLSMLNSSPTNQTISACESYFWPANGQTYTVSGNYSTTLTNIHSCDSIVNVNLSIINNDTNLLSHSSCNTYYWPLSGQNYTTSGNYTHALQSSSGCDSIIVLQLTINRSAESTQTVVACGEYMWQANGNVYTSSGSYSTILTTAHGCDSLVHLQLSIITIAITANPISQTVNAGSSVQFSVMANSSLVQYQWQINTGSGFVDLSNTAQYSDVTTSVLSVSNVTAANHNHQFRCVIRFESCTSNSEAALLKINGVSSIAEQNVEQTLRIYPNPVSEKLTIEALGLPIGEILFIVNQNGQVVYSSRLQNAVMQIDMHSFPPGLYLLFIGGEKGESYKFIKE